MAPEQTMNWNENIVSIVLQILQFQHYMVLQVLIVHEHFCYSESYCSVEL